MIVVIEAIRAIQNGIQLKAFSAEKQTRENAYAEFVKSLNRTDREFVKALLEEFERTEP